MIQEAVLRTSEKTSILPMACVDNVEIVTKCTKEDNVGSNEATRTTTNDQYKRSASDPLTAPKKHKKKQKKALQKMHISIEREHLKVPDIREIIMAVAANKTHSKWFQIIKPDEIKQVVILACPGLEYSDIDATGTLELLAKRVEDVKLTENFDELRSAFQVIYPTLLPGSKDSTFSALHALTHLHRTKAEVRKLHESGAQITILDLILSKQQMIDNNYSVELSDEQLQEGWFATKTSSHEPGMYSLDCEFCMSEKGKELARLSLVDADGNVVIDTFVKPQNPIIDYKTQYSGITPELLEGVTTTIEDVQNDFISKVNAEDYLIGHSLNSDLNVLKVNHQRIVDTSIIYDHPRGPPLKASLKWLSDKYLKRLIQNDESGHCSVEDSKACLDLVKLKLKSGLYYGSTIKDIPLKERLQNEHQVSLNVISGGAVGGFKFEDDSEIVKASLDSIDAKCEIVILNLQDLEKNKGWLGKATEDTDLGSVKSLLSSRISQIFETLPDGSLFILLGSLGNPLEMYRLQGLRRRYESMRRAGEDVSQLDSENQWNDKKVEQLYMATNIARSGFCMMGLKGYDITAGGRNVS